MQNGVFVLEAETYRTQFIKKQTVQYPQRYIVPVDDAYKSHPQYRKDQDTWSSLPKYLRQRNIPEAEGLISFNPVIKSIQDLQQGGDFELNANLYSQAKEGMMEVLVRDGEISKEHLQFNTADDPYTPRTGTPYLNFYDRACRYMHQSELTGIRKMSHCTNEIQFLLRIHCYLAYHHSVCPIDNTFYPILFNQIAAFWGPQNLNKKFNYSRTLAKMLRGQDIDLCGGCLEGYMPEDIRQHNKRQKEKNINDPQPFLLAIHGRTDLDDDVIRDKLVHIYHDKEDEWSDYCPLCGYNFKVRESDGYVRRRRDRQEIRHNHFRDRHLSDPKQALLCLLAGILKRNEFLEKPSKELPQWMPGFRNVFYEDVDNLWKLIANKDHAKGFLSGHYDIDSLLNDHRFFKEKCLYLLSLAPAEFRTRNRTLDKTFVNDILHWAMRNWRGLRRPTPPDGSRIVPLIYFITQLNRLSMDGEKAFDKEKGGWTSFYHQIELYLRLPPHLQKFSCGDMLMQLIAFDAIVKHRVSPHFNLLRAFHQLGQLTDKCKELIKIEASEMDDFNDVTTDKTPKPRSTGT